MADLFADSQDGTRLEAIDIANLWQDTGRTTAVTAAGQTVKGITDLSGNDRHGSEATNGPTYQITPARMVIDRVNDQIAITVPTGGWTGSMVIATTDGTASYDVTIPAGTYNLVKGGLYFPADAGSGLVGYLIRDGVMTAAEKASAEAYYVDNGATASYGDITVFADRWRDRSEITGFPSNIDLSSGTNFDRAWRSSGLLSFPSIDLSAGTSFSASWFGAPIATFPANMFDSVTATTFTNAFLNTNLDETSIDGILASLVTAGQSTGTFTQSGGSAPSATGEGHVTTLRSRGWTVTVTGGF